MPDVLDEQVKILDHNPNVGLVYAPYLLADQIGNIIDQPAIPDFCPEGDIFWKIIRSNPIGCLTAIFRKSCISRVGLLDPSIPGSDDLDLWIRIAELYDIAAIEKPVAVWRKPTPESNQGSSNLVGLTSQAVKTFKKKWSKLPRAIKEPENLVKVRREFIDFMMDQMISNNSSQNFFEKILSGDRVKSRISL